MRLGYLGFGTIARACAEGLVSDGHDIVVSERSRANSSELSARFDTVTVANNQGVLDASDVVFVGSTAEQAEAMLSALQFREGQRVISFMVGISPEQVQALVAPATFETLMIPFPSIASGGSPVLVFPASPTIEALYGGSNTVITMKSESDFNEFLAAQALLSVVAKSLAVGIDWLGHKTGSAHEAEKFLRLLIGGSIMAAPMETENAMADLVESLNTPGGLNQQLREYMADRNTYDDLVQGIEVLSARLSEG